MAKSKHAKQIARNKRRADRSLSTPKSENIAPLPDFEEMDSPDMQAVFTGQGTEELTEDVIKQLSAQGWPEKEIREMQGKGFRYSRSRNSLVGPPEEI
jgi:hypothetical protein